MPRFSSILSIAATFLFTAAAAQGGMIVFANPATALAGDLGDYFDVMLTNTGSDLVVGGFSFALSVGDTNVTFTQVTMNTAVPYIFAGDSFVYLSLGGTNINILPAGQTVNASDADNSFLGVTIAGGATVGLGRVYFDVGAASASTIAVEFVASGTSLSDAFGKSTIPIETLNDGLITLTSVPEPSALPLVGLAFLVIVFAHAMAGRRRKRDF